MPSIKTTLTRFDLTRINLRRRFAVLLGGIAALALVLFVLFAQYSLKTTEQEFEKRGLMMAELLGKEATYNLIMQDTEGLQELLGHVVGEEKALAGGFYDAQKTLVIESKLASTLGETERTVPEAERIQWTNDVNGKPVLKAISEVVNNEEKLGYTLVVLPSDALQNQKRAGLYLSIGVPLIIALFAWITLLLVRRTVISPVDELRKAAGAVEQGDLSVRVNIKQKDEIGQLAASFNAMVASSERNMGALQEQRESAEAAQRNALTLQQQTDEERQYLQQQFERISEVISAVTRGDLTQRLRVEREDAVGTLMHQINYMIRDLESLIREVHGAGDRLSQAANQVATAAEEMSAGAQGQASQTIEVAAAVEEMSATIAESSRNAFEANQMAQRASSIATEGEQVFQETTQGMIRIAGIVRESAEKVTALGTSSAQIGEIVRVIGDIADQTNLLALNAAIEAARAGDQGRGFAVVADEVRKLAERTTAATKEIADMIRRIQQNTEVVVASMTKGNGEVETGLRLADNAASSLTEIVSSINGMVMMIDQIAAGSQEQSATSSQISRNVESISAVSTEVSRATTDLAHTADAMTGQASDLRQLIDRFQISTASSAKANAYAQGDGASLTVF